MKAFKNSNMFDGNHGSAAAQELAAFMARAAVQVPAFREIKATIINSSLVRGDNSSSSRVIKAIRSS